jgi:hypothetical protein
VAAAAAFGDTEPAAAAADGPAPVEPAPLDPQPANAAAAAAAMQVVAALKTKRLLRVVRPFVGILAIALSCVE